MKMRLHMVRGSLFAPASSSSSGSDGGAGLGSAMAMDARVWSRMLDDILWRVLRLLPPGKQVQVQLVSRKWRQVLTSADFHAACAADEEELATERVVACATSLAAGAVTVTLSGSGWSSSSSSSRAEAQVPVVEIDLTFLPRKWFRRTNAYYAAVEPRSTTTRFHHARPPYFVLAAGDGLVCVANTDVYMARDAALLRPNQVCVLNPLTRTYRMLPALPLVVAQAGLRQITAAAATTLTFVMHHSEHYIDWAMGTCALGEGAAWAVRQGRVRVPAPPPGSWWRPAEALCGGQVFWCMDGKLRVLDVAAATSRSAGVSEAAASEDAGLALPSVETLGLDAAAACYKESDVVLLAHRGTLFLLAHLLDPQGPHHGSRRPHAQVACGLWRLAVAAAGGTGTDRRRRGMEWQPVTRLDVAEVERLAGLGRAEPGRERFVFRVLDARGVRELLCCNLLVRPGKSPTPPARQAHGLVLDDAHHCVLGFNLDAGHWELVKELVCQQRGRIATHVELRPHLFLSSPVNKSATSHPIIHPWSRVREGTWQSREGLV